MDGESTAVMSAPVADVRPRRALPCRGVDRGSRLRCCAMAISLCIFTLFHLPFIAVEFPSDEGENLLGGWLMSQGQVIYRDYFSQHAPFGHIYSAACECLFPRNWVAHRHSVALLGLLTLGYLQLRFLRKSDTVFFWAIVILTCMWPFYAAIYWGYMLLNDNLASYACLLLFVLVFSSLWHGTPHTKLDHFLIGLSAYVGVFSIPFAVFPVGIALSVYFVM